MSKYKQTTKQNLLIVTILVISILVIGFILRNRMPTDLKVDPASNSQTQKEILTLSTVFVDGEIGSVTENVLVLKSGENEISLIMSKDVAIYKKDNSQIQALSIDDLRDKAKVQIELNQENSEIIGIEVM